MLCTVARRWSVLSTLPFLGEPLPLKRETIAFRFFLAEDVGLWLTAGIAAPSELCRSSEAVLGLGGGSSGCGGKKERATRLTSDADGAADFSSMLMTPLTIF